ARFGRKLLLDPWPGYGRVTHEIVSAIGRGGDWRRLSAAAFNGAGSGETRAGIAQAAALGRDIDVLTAATPTRSAPSWAASSPCATEAAGCPRRGTARARRCRRSPPT